MATVRYTIEELTRKKPKIDWAVVNKIKKSGKILDDSKDDFDIAKGKIVYRGAIVGRPRKDIVRRTVTLRIPDPLLKHLKSLGKGWNTRASAYLERGILAGNL